MRFAIKTVLLTVIAATLSLLPIQNRHAQAIVFDLTAEAGVINVADGAQITMWSFRDSAGTFRYPGPVLDVTMGDTVTVHLTNNLPDTDGAGPGKADPVSMLFPGQENIEISHDGGFTWTPASPTYGIPGDRASLRSMSAEAAPGAMVSYRFVATHPGTFGYYSGTKPHKHIDMGLLGALIVRTGTPNQAYLTSGTTYDQEILQLYTAVDPDQHARVSRGLSYQQTAYLPQNWFINGRAFPDTLADDNVGYLPTQPMGALTALYPGERTLWRMLTFDREPHPMHSHGNHATVIARNGRPLSSDSLNGDLVIDEYTQVLNPGETQDSIFTWGPPAANFGFDPLGLDPAQPAPVITLPETKSPNTTLRWGQFYSGSPYLGKKADLPAGDAAINMNQMGEMYMPFHSHHELELQNQGAAPGGMISLIMICPPTSPTCPGH